VFSGEKLVTWECPRCFERIKSLQYIASSNQIKFFLKFCGFCGSHLTLKP
jgi:hypothetical protein